MKLVQGLLILAAFAFHFVQSGEVAVASSAASATVTAVSSYITPPVDVHHIRCECNHIFEPVCGSDGITYSNECVMCCVSKEHVNKGRSPVRLLHHGKCHILSCDCLPKLDPVCGTNNQTYLNDCYRICVSKYHEKHGLRPISLAYRDICKPTMCYCTDAIIPVCGTDNKSYRNICHLQCSSRANHARGMSMIFIQHNGACRNETCNCPLIEKQICASDGNTYHNKCGLDCQNRRRAQLGLEPLIYEYPGSCIKCACSAKIAPVCGSDGNTYPNYCFLFCKNRTRKRQSLPRIKVWLWGPCNCGCTKNYKPVCANDRRTWTNRCLLDCENRKRARTGQPRLAVSYEGECRRRVLQPELVQSGV